MFEKNPCWTRSRVGRNRVHWVAFDDRAGAEDRKIVDQGYATSLVEADAQARSALADAGMFQARRQSKSSGFAPRPKGESASKKPDRTESSRPRQYLYTRRQDERDDRPMIAAHLILKKTARRVYVTRRSCGPDQLGTPEENWSENERAIALDRLKLEQDGSAYSGSHRQSDFYPSREAALGDAFGSHSNPARLLGLSPPFTVDEIKSAYRRRSLEVHPDRGGSPEDFQAIEAAYRHLLRESQTPEA